MGCGGGGTDCNNSLEKIMYDNMTTVEKAKFFLIPCSYVRLAREKDKKGLLDGPTAMAYEYTIALGEEILRLGCYVTIAYYISKLF